MILRIAIKGFLVGMLFEYLLRVELSILPLLIMIFIIFTIGLEYILDSHSTTTPTSPTKIPDGWMVNSSSQNLDMTWYLELDKYRYVNDSDDGKLRLVRINNVWVDNAKTYEEALEKVIRKIKLGDY